MKQIYERIASDIKERGFKQTAIAEKIGVRPDVLGNMLNGRRNITAEEYEKLCIALERDPNYYMKTL